jgi:EmrB/QacA subfamily drug resistance transporter
MRATAPSTPARTAPTTTRDAVVAMSGLLLGMFVAILAGTVVSTALPRIIHDLGGGQTAYTWVVTASLLATTVTTPVWGKLADLLDRKALIQLSLVVFTVGSALCGFAQNPGTLIGFRVLQGIGSGGMMALVQIVMADIVSPRDRGKYMGLIGAVMAVATVGGPLLGGVITDAWNWRWVFYVALPVAIAALIVLQKTLHVPPRRPGKVRIDYLGTSLIAGGVSLLLIWVSLAGNSFDWISATSGVLLGAAILLLVALVIVELHAAEPVIPMTLFASRTFSLSVVASIAVGVGMFGVTVYLTEYMQLSRGATPTESGLMTFPLVAGLMVASTVAGALISKRGRWKSYMVTGAALMTLGMGLMATMQWDTNFAVLSLYMVVLGGGVGMVMQNLVLIVQNDVDPRQIGVASSGVAFFRTLGGTIGVSALGALLTSGLAGRFADRRPDLVAAAGADGSAGKAALADLQRGETPNVHGLIEGGARHTAGVIQSVFGSAIGELFLVTVPLALITVLALAFVPNKPLGRQTTGQRLAGGEASAGEGAASQDDAAENDAAPVGVAVRTAGPGAVSPIVMDTIVPLGESAGETGSTQV